MLEVDLIPIICVLLFGGVPEARVNYHIDAGSHHVRVDCLTETHAIEIGLDARRSSYDSVHQAVFAAAQSDRDPMVVMVDTNGVEDNAEFQVETVARQTEVNYIVYDLDYLIRMQMTAPFRTRRIGVVPIN